MPPSAQQIADTVVALFNHIGPFSAKPVTRSNGVPEWTVMASIVAIIDDQIIPLTIATGVKALPDTVRNYSHGTIVHDLHAEILALRCFNRLLIKEVGRLAQGIESSLIESGGGGGGDSGGKNNIYRLKPAVRLALFVTEPPCGDCSMSYTQSQAHDSTPWTEPSSTPWTEPCSTQSLLRGRNLFYVAGAVRTKPGRPDSPPTLSKSCSDKLCLKQALGINSCITSKIIDPIYLDYLVMPLHKFNHDDFNRCFTRLECVKYLTPLTYSHDDYRFHKPTNTVLEPSPVSLLYLHPINELQVLNNGVKNGSYIKNKRPSRGGESIVSNYVMMRELLKVMSSTTKTTPQPPPQPQPTYLHFKNSNTPRQHKKLTAKQKLNWKDTSPDNFSIDAI